MTEEKTDTKTAPKADGRSLIDALFNVGAHLGYTRARRHASMKNVIFGAKDKTDIIDLTQTAPMMEEALQFVKTLGAQGENDSLCWW